MKYARRGDMRYMVHLEVPVEAGNRLENEGNPMAYMQQFVEQWKPEAFYAGIARRTIYMVMDIDDPAKMGELMGTLAHKFGAYATFDPIISMGDVKAMGGKVDEVMQHIRQSG